MNKYAEVYKEEFQKEALILNNIINLIRSKALPGAGKAISYTASRPSLMADIAVGGALMTQPGRDLVGSTYDGIKGITVGHSENASVGTDSEFKLGPKGYRKTSAKNMAKSILESTKKKMKKLDPEGNYSDEEVSNWLKDSKNENTYSPEYERLMELADTGESGGLGYYTNSSHVDDPTNADSYKSLQNRGLQRIEKQWGSGVNTSARRRRGNAY